MPINPPNVAGQIQRMQAQVKTLIDDDAVALEEHRLSWAQRFVHFWLLVGQNFVRNRCPVRASALAYTTLLAVVPLLAVSISVAALFLPREEVKQRRELEDLIDSAITRVAPALGVDTEDASSPTSPDFSADDYAGLHALTQALVRHADPVSSSLWERLPNEAQDLAREWNGTDSGRHAVETNISDMLNLVLSDTNFYSPQRFAGISLSPATQALLSPTNRAPDLRRRNRLLLQDVYGKDLIVPMADPSATSSQAHQKRSEVAGKIIEFVGNIRFGTIGASAMGGLLFVAISLLRTVESAFNDIWGVPRGRTWFMSIVLYWAVITLGPITVVVAKGANYLALLHYTGGGTLAVLSGVMRSLSWLVTLGVMSLAFAGLYLWMPNTRVQWQAALVGGAVAAALWTLNGRLSALYNTKVVTYHAIYGSLGVVPLFLLGMYLSWLILLFGAQTAYVYQFRHAYLQERWAGRVHHQAREFIALRLMTLIGIRFLNGEPPMTALQLAERLAIPPKLARDVLQTLVGTRLLAEAAGVEIAYLPARPLDQMTTWEILNAIRAGLGHDVHTSPDDARTVVRTEFDEVIAAGATRARSTTLRDLVERTQGAPG